MFDPTKATATAKVKADTFVREQLYPAMAESLDGGMAIARAIVDEILFTAAYQDRACDLDVAN